MAFNDIVQDFYDGKVRISYLDKPHMYFKQDRIDFDLDPANPKAWSTKTRPKGTTTLLEDTLEKKGLMQWPKGLALGELFGFYNFTNDDGQKLIGFSKHEDGSLKGTMWELDGAPSINPGMMLPIVKSASDAWLRKKQKGADIGSVVHEAIENFITGKTFSILETYTKSVEETEYDTEADKEDARGQIVEDVKCAEQAFAQFVKWWNETQPELLGTEDLIYSLEHNVAGTYDARLRMDGKLIIADWKTSNASKSKEAAAPEGIYYTYFIQSAIYALVWEEMHSRVVKTSQGITSTISIDHIVDDLLIVSCRKDGGFNTKLASEVGITSADWHAWARAVILCYRLREKSRNALWEQGKEEK